MPGIISSNVPPITLRVTRKDVIITGQIKLLEEEKVSRHSVGLANRQFKIVLASATVTQMAKTMLAAKTINMIMLLAKEDEGRYISKNSVIVPKADKMSVGKNDIIINGKNLRQFLEYKSQLSTINSVAVFNINL